MRPARETTSEVRQVRRQRALRPRVPLRRPRLRDLKNVPVLPSLVTLANLFFGFLAIAKAADALLVAGPRGVLTVESVHLIETAALLVFVAMVFDGLDGAVARLTNQTTVFGAQLDSLADAVTFGVAPAFLAKVLVEFHARGPAPLLPPHAKLYYAAAAIFVLCAAMRLARFNVEVESPRADDHKEFSGLPSPAAAAVICSAIAFFATRRENNLSALLLPPSIYEDLILAMPVALVLLGLLMVSRFPYPHLVNSLVRGRHTFPFLATLVVLTFVAAIEWQLAVVVLSLVYVASGILIGLWRLVTRGRMGPPFDNDGGGEPPGPDDAEPELFDAEGARIG